MILSPRSGGAALTRLAVHAMGTRFELVLHGLDEVALRAAGEEAVAEIEDCDRRFSLFRRDSLLSFINSNAASRPVKVDRECFALLAAAVEIGGLVGGAFDITLAPVMRIWRLHGETSTAPEPLSLSEAATGLDLLELDAEALTVRFRRSGVCLDLGGIAKGHALFCAAQVLRREGVPRALLHGGTSSVTAIGAPPGEEGWRVRLGTGDEAPIVTLRDLSLSVSAPSGRVIEVDGRRLGHIIDPATRTPVEGARLAAAIDESPLVAEGLSTGLVVLDRRPEGVPRRVTTVLHRRDGTWCVAGERVDLVCFPPDAGDVCMERA